MVWYENERRKMTADFVNFLFSALTKKEEMSEVGPCSCLVISSLVDCVRHSHSHTPFPVSHSLSHHPVSQTHTSQLVPLGERTRKIVFYFFFVSWVYLCVWCTRSQRTEDEMRKRDKDTKSSRMRRRDNSYTQNDTDVTKCLTAYDDDDFIYRSVVMIIFTVLSSRLLFISHIRT